MVCSLSPTITFSLCPRCYETSRPLDNQCLSETKHRDYISGLGCGAPRLSLERIPHGKLRTGFSWLPNHGPSSGFSGCETVLAFGSQSRKILGPSCGYRRTISRGSWRRLGLFFSRTTLKFADNPVGNNGQHFSSSCIWSVDGCCGQLPAI